MSHSKWVVVGLVGVAIIGLLLYIMARPKAETIVFDGSTKIMSAPIPEDSGNNPPGSNVVEVAEKGDEAQILEFSESNGKATYKVKTKNGKVGYVFSGDAIQVDAH